MRLELKIRNSGERRPGFAKQRTPVARHLVIRVGRRLLLHILPLLAMLLILSWLALRAGHSIQQAKQPPQFSALSHH